MEAFNPYHVWLGIPPDEQPANHYRLLGLRVFETSADVIDNAADRHMAHLRTFQGGKHGEFTQRLLNEVAAARVCLLDAKKRAAYDQQLRAELAANGALPTAGDSAISRQPPPPIDSPAPPATAARRSAAAPVAQAPATAAPATDVWSDLIGDPNAKGGKTRGNTSARSASVKSNPAKAIAEKRAAHNRNLSIGIAAAVLLAAAVGIGLFAMNAGPSTADCTLAFDWPSADRAGATMTVDDTAVNIPGSGPWEFRCPPGSHRILAQRGAYKLDEEVTAAPGQRQTVAAEWSPKAVLVLNWPLAIRSGAELKIDGRPQPVSQRAPLEIAVEPGRHAIEISRGGSPPIIASANVAPDGRELVAIAPPPTTGTLLVDWPAEDRSNATLTVDGQPRAIDPSSDANPVELSVPAGQHQLRIARAGFEPFSQSVDVAAGTNQSIKPAWTPEKKKELVDDHPRSQPKPVEKSAPPSAADQERLAHQLDELYKTSGAEAKNPAKAQQLYEVATKQEGTPAERYMLWMRGAEIAAAAGDLQLLLTGANALEAGYVFDALDLKQRLFDKFVTAASADQSAALVSVAEQLVDQAQGADQYEAALVMATIASRAAAKSQLPNRQQIEDQLSHRRHDIRMIQSIYASAKKAEESLAKNPADADANLAAGRWQAFYKNAWAAGLPLLSRGSDEKLKSLADAELKAPAGADDKVQLADAWWDLSSKEAGAARDSIRLHAADLYNAALPGVTSALKKAAIEKHLAEIPDLASHIAAKAPKTTPPAGGAEFPIGQWVDVLGRVDPAKDVVTGTWTRQEAGLAVAASEASRITIPVAVDGGYDLDVEFTRTTGHEDVNVMLPVGAHACTLILSGISGDASAVAAIDGKGLNEGGNPTLIKPGKLKNGHRYRLSIAVRMPADDRASIDVFLDGKRYLPHWEGDANSLREESYWKMPHLSELGLAAQRGDTTFHVVRLRMQTGHASDAANTESADSTSSSNSTADSSKTPNILSAKWGQKKKWLDVTKIVRETIAQGGTVYANSKFFKNDPSPGEKKELKITYKLGDTELSKKINDDGTWSKEDYEKPGDSAGSTSPPSK